MTTQLSQLAVQRFVDNNGNALAGGQLYTYQAGTSTLQPTYTDSTGLTANTNPIVLNARGEANVWTTGGLAYKFVLIDASGNLIWSVDNITDGSLSSSLAAALANTTDPTKGAGMVRWFRNLVGFVSRWVSDKLAETLSVDDFGAVGDGVTDDYAAILAAQTAIAATGGGRLLFTFGKTYNVKTSIPERPGITYCGTGRSAVDLTSWTGARIVSSTTDIFVNAATETTGVKFKDLWIESLAGGGHIFNWSLAGATAKRELSGCVLVQNNAAKSVINGVSSGGVFSIWFHDFEYKYAAQNTVPAINIVSPTVNSVVLEKFWSTCASQVASTGTYSVWIESTNAAGAAIGNLVRQGVFEFSTGGAVQMLSCINSGIEQCGVYDNSVTSNNPQFRIAKGSIGPASSNCWVKGSSSAIGTAAKPDLQIDLSVSAQAGFMVEGCSFVWVDGVATNNGPGVVFNANNIQNYQNLAYLKFGAGADSDIAWNNTLASSRSYAIWNGYFGNAEGYLNIYQNGVYVGAISPGALFQWGGTLTSPNFYVGQNGSINNKAQIYPGTGAGSDQAASGLLAGTGVPPNTSGNNGDFFFRSDGAAGTSIYMRRAGAWVGIV